MTLRSSRMMLSINMSVSFFIAWRKLSSKSGNVSKSGLMVFTFLKYSHCPAKLSTRAFARIFQHPPHLPLEDRRIFEKSLACSIQQFVVGNRAPKEERQTGSQIQIADTMGAARSGICRIGFETEQEVGTGQQKLYGSLDARFERAAFVATPLINRDQL